MPSRRPGPVPLLSKKGSRKLHVRRLMHLTQRVTGHKSKSTKKNRWVTIPLSSLLLSMKLESHLGGSRSSLHTKRANIRVRHP